MAPTDTAQSETHDFQAEVSKLLHLMVHSVYSEKEVFLRELISNGSDACDKLRYQALTEPSLLDGDPNFRIEIHIDKKKRLISIADNGIGMDRRELIDNLGTIARSGTNSFVEQLTGDAAKDAQLIGQFGVGFYSAFMVADKVEVTTRKVPSDTVLFWKSDGTGSFEVSEAGTRERLLDGRGTRVTLHLRKGEKEFLEDHRLRQIVKSYSDHIAIPIIVRDKEKQDAADEPVNAVGALWTRPKSEITADQYKEFYHHAGHVFDDPWMTIHYKAEGRHEYNVLLFMPTTRPMDLFDPKRATRVKLYVRRVFVTDDADLLPGYLRFVRGIIDSEDMPLNISREMLQNNPILARIRKAVTKRVFSELTKKAKKDGSGFETFWEAFGPVIKEGIYEDPERRDDLLNLARFKSTKGEEWRTLKDYVADMVPNQTAIHYIHGEDPATIGQSPQLEGYRARNMEVLLLSDPVDAFWVSVAQGFDGKPFQSVTKGEAQLESIAKTATGETTGDDAPGDAAMGTLIALIKQTLGESIADVRRSDRLTESAVCLVAPEGGLDDYMERILAQSSGKDGGGDPYANRILEINADHGLIRRLAEKAHADGVTPELEDAARLLLDQARIIEGAPVSDPTGFGTRLGRLLEKGLD